MAIENVLERYIWENIDAVMDKKPGICRCDTCRTDIAAYALNRLQPFYASTDLGSALGRAQFTDNQKNVDMLVILTEAVEVVGSNPRHKTGSA